MAPLDKAVKYDRQLRLWAANGQAALEDSRIALLNGTAVGTETLKNLVLPGIGSYTIIDAQTVTEQDTGENFFLDVDCIGSSRAQKTCEYLQELNSDVVGKYRDTDPERLIQDDPSYFTDNFDIVLVTRLQANSLQSLAKALWSANIPLFVVESIGFVGFLRIALPEHTIIETHPDAIVDLRLDNPWPELSVLAEQLNLEEMNDNQHTHVPYVLLLLHYLRIWKESHDGRAPGTFDEKKEFKALIKSGMRNADEDNFDEAVNNVWRACSTTNVPSMVKALFDDPKAQTLTSSTDDFWFLVRALNDFVKSSGTSGGEGLLPVSGTIPDMKSDTNSFIQLQKTYRAAAMRDIAAIKSILTKHLNEHGRPNIPDTEIESFCKHAAYLRVIRYRSLQQETQDPRLDFLQKACEEDIDGPIYWYLVKSASEKFHLENDGTWPDAEFTGKKSLLDTTLAMWPTLTIGKAQRESVAKVCREVERAGQAELHNISSFMGGIAAQEIIKVVTKQYVPINNTVIFDGIRSVTAVYEL